MATTGELLDDGAARLRAAGSESARLDAELLLGFAVGVDRTAIVAHHDAPVGADAAARYEASIAASSGGRAGRLHPGHEGVLRARVRRGRSRAHPAAGDRSARRGGRSGGHAPVDRRARDRPVRRRSASPTSAQGAGRSRSPSSRRCVVAGRTARSRSSQRTSRRTRWTSRARTPWGTRSPTTCASWRRTCCRRSVEPFDLVLANLPYVRSDAMAGLPVATSFEPSLALDGGPDGLAIIGRLLDRLPGRPCRGRCRVPGDRGGPGPRRSWSLVAATLPGWACTGAAGPGRAAAGRARQPRGWVIIWRCLR